MDLKKEQRRIYLDTEFHQRVIRGIPTVELISIGMVDQAGKSYHAVSNEFNLNAAKGNHFLRHNVLPSLPPKKEWQGREAIRQGVLSYLAGDPVQIAYWVIPHDVVLFEQLVSDSIIHFPDHINRIAINLAQIWDGLGQPDILPEQPEEKIHHALEDAKWLRRVDRALMHYQQKLTGKKPEL